MMEGNDEVSVVNRDAVSDTDRLARVTDDIKTVKGLIAEHHANIERIQNGDQ